MGRTTIHPLMPDHRVEPSALTRFALVVALGAGALAVALALIGRVG